MQTSDFDFIYPENLVATEPLPEHRTMWVQGSQEPREIGHSEIFSLFEPGDVLVINDTKVLRRRVTSRENLEILFLRSDNGVVWDVLFPARGVRDDKEIALPGGVTAKLVARGLPQKLLLSMPLTESYFAEFGELALPPYIQKARGERHNRADEERWYQTAWAERPGSQAAPTASLHFSASDLDKFRDVGVKVLPLTLHVGMGTFLPIKTENLMEHQMHSEPVFIPAETIQQISEAKKCGRRVWALGTTVVRALESWGHGRLQENESGSFCGDTHIFIRPEFRFEVVDALLTNFHQPKSTLLALVSAFAGRECALSAYEWAIAHQFRLFSYGDLSIWTR